MTSGGLKGASSEFLTRRPGRDGLRAEVGETRQADRIVFGDGAIQRGPRGIDSVTDRYQLLLSGPSLERVQ